MKCLNCNQEINENAKFCRFCGSENVQAARKEKAADEISCPSCGKPVSASAKFCRFCGASMKPATEAPAAVEAKDVAVESNFITWHILPGQLAVKIDESDIEGYKTLKGVYITPGTKALFYVNGKYAAQLDSGKYSFKELGAQAPKEEKKEKRVDSFFRNIANHIANGVSALFGRDRSSTHDNSGNRSFYTIVLVRGVEFPLVFDLENINTKNIRSNVGLHFLCKLTNLNAFFEAELVDKKSASLKTFADSLLPAVTAVVNSELSSVSPMEIDNNAPLSDRVLQALRERIGAQYSYVSVSSVISLTANQEELEKIRGYKEELYIADLELEHLRERNNYLNRLQSVEHSHELSMAREEVDFRALMDKIDEDGMLNDAKKQQFAYMLLAQYELSCASTDSEKEAALNKLRASNMLSNEEIDHLQREIDQRAAMENISNEHALAMATLQNKIILDREALRWEVEIGNKALENELTRQRMAAEFEDERRNADLDFEKRRMSDKMDLLRQAQAIREEREQAQHQRQMEAEQQRIDAELARYKIHAGMSFEQIMASNPDITPEAAAALAKKFEADAAAANNDRTIDLQRQHNEDLKAILAQQMTLTRDIATSQNAAKQQEIDRINEASERNQDRFLSGMQTTINAVAGATRAAAPAPAQQPASAPAAPAVVFCPNCGKKHAPDTIACDECGSSL